VPAERSKTPKAVDTMKITSTVVLMGLLNARHTPNPVNISKAMPKSAAGMPIAHSNARDCLEKRVSVSNCPPSLASVLNLNLFTPGNQLPPSRFRDGSGSPKQQLAGASGWTVADRP
jgi:hypothetical protein